jgi:hypothetical protein
LRGKNGEVREEKKEGRKKRKHYFLSVILLKNVEFVAGIQSNLSSKEGVKN